MERKIGEIFEYNGEWYQCIIGHCNQCSFDEAGTCKFIGNPYCAYRNDKKLACFKKLEKVGEPYNKLGIVVQKYKVDIPIKMPDEPNMYFRLIDNIVEIEIKQNKEDMEENKVKLDKLVDDYTACRIKYAEFDKEIKALYDKEESEPTLKEFDLEAAKAGKPVCTRDGRKARIICFDVKGDVCPIIALVEENGMEVTKSYDVNGRANYKNADNYDLMMLPEKKEGWINIYKSPDCRYKGHVCITIFKTKEEALQGADDDVCATVKINWSE